MKTPAVVQVAQIRRKAAGMERSGCGVRSMGIVDSIGFANGWAMVGIWAWLCSTEVGKPGRVEWGANWGSALVVCGTLKGRF